MRKVIFFALLLIFMHMLPASANSEVSVYVDDTKLEFDVSPTIVEGRTMVPIRAIFEALGATVEWDGTTSTAIAVKEQTTVKIQIDNSNMYVNEEVKVLDVPAMLKDGRTLVPLRAVSEAFECDVQWEDATKSAKIYTKEKEPVYSTEEDRKEIWDMVGSVYKLQETAHYINPMSFEGYEAFKKVVVRLHEETTALYEKSSKFDDLNVISVNAFFALAEYTKVLRGEYFSEADMYAIVENAKPYVELMSTEINNLKTNN